MSPEPENGYPEHDTIANVEAWVGDDPVRAREALRFEHAGQQRPRLLEKLGPLAAKAPPEQPGSSQPPAAAPTGSAGGPDSLDETSAPARRERDEAPANSGADAEFSRTPWDEAHAANVGTAAADPDLDAAEIANRDRTPEHFVEAGEESGVDVPDLDAADQKTLQDAAQRARDAGHLDG